MKTPKESITVRFNHKHVRKDKTLQVLFELRNLTPVNPLRIACLDENRAIIHLSKDNLKKGYVIACKDAFKLNQYLQKTQNKILLVIDFLKFFNLTLDKKTIEQYLYYKFSDVYHFTSNVYDDESAKEYITNYFIKTDEQHQIEDVKSQLAHKDALMNAFDNGEYKPKGLIEAVEFYNYENINKGKINVIFNAYLTHSGYSDIMIEKFDAKKFEDIISYISKNAIAKGGKYYSIATIQGFIKTIKILLRNLKKDYTIDSNLFDVSLKIGKRKNSDVSFNYDERKYVISINYNELQAIKDGNYSRKLAKDEYDKMEKIRKLFMIQTMLGGLRYNELISIKKDNFFKMNDKVYLNLRSNKTNKTIDSPLHNELQPILESIDYDIKSLIFFSSNLVYNKNLRKLVKLLKLEREVAVPLSHVNQQSVEIKVKKLYEVFSSKYARKALVTLLFNTGKYSIDEIATITNHSSDSIKNYIAILTDKKETMINTI